MTVRKITPAHVRLIAEVLTMDRAQLATLKAKLSERLSEKDKEELTRR